MASCVLCVTPLVLPPVCFLSCFVLFPLYCLLCMLFPLYCLMYVSFPLYFLLSRVSFCSPCIASCVVYFIPLVLPHVCFVLFPLYCLLHVLSYSPCSASCVSYFLPLVWPLFVLFPYLLMQYCPSALKPNTAVRQIQVPELSSMQLEGGAAS